GGEHVHFVDDVDFVTPLGRRVADVVAQFADLLDAVVGGSVNLEYVETAAFGDLDADVLFWIEISSGTVLGFERLGENARGGSLARAARPDKEIGLGDAAEAQRVGEGAHDRFLPDDF